MRAADPGDLPRPVPAPAEVRRAAGQILSGRQFRRPPRSVVQVVLDWVGRALDRILTFGGHGRGAGLVVALVATAAVAVLVVRFARTVRTDPGRGVSVIAEVGRPPTDWRAEAEADEAAGRWRQALRCRYRAMVADLAARGVVEEVPGRTTGEYRSAVTRSAPAAAADFGGATELFERAWYGARPTGPDESTRFRELEGRVLAGLGARSGGGRGSDAVVGGDRS